jgi:NAD-dependent DNA ligase
MKTYTKLKYNLLCKIDDFIEKIEKFKEEKTQNPIFLEIRDLMDDYSANYYSEAQSLGEHTHFKKKEVQENPFSGKTLCVTGKLNHFTRDSINEKIAELGAKAAGSVSKNTDYLITNEASGSSNYKKAVELNIPIITEEEFLEMIGDSV